MRYSGKADNPEQNSSALWQVPDYQITSAQDSQVGLEICSSWEVAQDS